MSCIRTLGYLRSIGSEYLGPHKWKIEGGVRDLLNHLTKSSNVPDIAFPVISRSRVLSSSSIAASMSRWLWKLVGPGPNPLAAPKLSLDRALDRSYPTAKIWAHAHTP